MSEKIRDLLAISDLNASDAMAIIERAQEMAALWRRRRTVQSLAGRRIVLVVNDSGWRNTTAFDLGIQAMGGICVHAPLQWDTREDLPDLAAYLDNWFDGIVTRAPDLTVMRSLANHARAPVINARTRQNHPCETLGDLAFQLHRHGRIEGIKVGLSLRNPIFWDRGSRLRRSCRSTSSRFIPTSGSTAMLRLPRRAFVPAPI